MTIEVAWYCLLDRFVVALCQGWRLPAHGGWLGHHGHHSVLLVRAAAAAPVPPPCLSRRASGQWRAIR